MHIIRQRCDLPENTIKLAKEGNILVKEKLVKEMIYNYCYDIYKDESKLLSVITYSYRS